MISPLVTSNKCDNKRNPTLQIKRVLYYKYRSQALKALN